MSFLKAHVSQKRHQRSNMDDTATYDENPGAETDGDGVSGDITSHETQEEEDKAVFDEKLINSVFNYEILYDLGNQYYYDTARKENAWEEIAKNMGMSGKKTTIQYMFYSTSHALVHVLLNKVVVVGSSAFTILILKP